MGEGGRLVARYPTSDKRAKTKMFPDDEGKTSNRERREKERETQETNGGGGKRSWG